MSIFSKIFTAIRGGAREIGESIVDKNGVRIFEQEIKEAEEQLAKAKRDLADVMAKVMQAERKIAGYDEDIAKHEEYASKALDKGDESLAMEIAHKIADFQSEREIQVNAHQSFKAHADRLKAMIKKTAKALKEMERQLVMVKTTESVQKATSAITNNFASGSSKLLTAKESLDRIKQRQEDLDDRLKAGEALSSEFNGGDLEAKMKEAGITGDDGSANDILAKLKAKKNS